MTKVVPAVVLQVIAGLLLAQAGILETTPLMMRIGEVGLILMLFNMGLETDLGGLMSRGRDAAAVAVLGVVFSGILGFAAALLLGWSTSAAVVTGGVLCATSIAISASVLGNTGWLARAEGQIVLAAAVLDDVIGLLILAFVSRGTSASISADIAQITIRSAVMLSLLAAVVWFANRLMRDQVTRRGGRLVLVLGSVACVAGAISAQTVGLAPFIGAFLAGAVLHERAAPCMSPVKRAGAILAPVYFILIGAMVDIGSLASLSVMFSAIALLFAGFLAKVLSGVGSAKTLDRLTVGLAMVPRGEVGLIFAATGLAAGLVSPGVYAPLVGSVLLTTIIGPIVLRQRITRSHLPQPRTAGLGR